MKSNNINSQMKGIKKIFWSFLFLLICSFIVTSCNEDEFLETRPIDFYSPSNSFITYADYDAAVMNLYRRVRDEFFTSSDARSFPSLGFQGTDIYHNHKDIGFDTDLSSVLLPTNDGVVFNGLWQPAYRIIFDANAIIERADSDENELTAEEKEYFSAEAKFFRGYMYKMLANLYGNVPVVLEETKSPKRDYENSERQAVYQQAASDLADAANVLGDISEVPDHKINNLAALHLLAEVYISLERWQDAIDAASSVINHSATSLYIGTYFVRGTKIDLMEIQRQYGFYNMNIIFLVEAPDEADHYWKGCSLPAHGRQKLKITTVQRVRWCQIQMHMLQDEVRDF